MKRKFLGYCLLAEIFTFTYPSTATHGGFFTCFLSGLDDMQEPQVTAYEKENSTIIDEAKLCSLQYNADSFTEILLKVKS